MSAVTRREFLRGAALTGGVLILPIPSWFAKNSYAVDMSTVTWTSVTASEVTYIAVDSLTVDIDQIGPPIAGRDFMADVPRPKGSTVGSVEMTAQGVLMLRKDAT